LGPAVATPRQRTFGTYHIFFYLQILRLVNLGRNEIEILLEWSGNDQHASTPCSRDQAESEGRRGANIKGRVPIYEDA